MRELIWALALALSVASLELRPGFPEMAAFLGWLAFSVAMVHLVFEVALVVARRFFR